MSGEIVKVFHMGKRQPDIELEPRKPTHVDYYFGEVRLSKPAIDLASKYVPEEIWKEVGLYSWLERAAKKAFDELPVGESSVERGRLRYIFEAARDGRTPYLVSLVLLPPKYQA